jgi:hypothetical protein
MNGYAIFAFVVMPAIVLAVGYICLRLFEWNLDRAERARAQAARAEPRSALAPLDQIMPDELSPKEALELKRLRSEAA